MIDIIANSKVNKTGRQPFGAISFLIMATPHTTWKILSTIHKIRLEIVKQM